MFFFSFFFYGIQKYFTPGYSNEVILRGASEWMECKNLISGVVRKARITIFFLLAQHSAEKKKKEKKNIWRLGYGFLNAADHFWSQISIVGWTGCIQKCWAMHTVYLENQQRKLSLHQKTELDLFIELELIGFCWGIFGLPANPGQWKEMIVVITTVGLESKPIPIVWK
jgi:hypothetical protein